MIDRPFTVKIDSAKCIGCGACRLVCPSDTLSIIDGKAVLSGDQSLIALGFPDEDDIRLTGRKSALVWIWSKT